jgi:hypothetical protein
MSTYQEDKEQIRIDNHRIKQAEVFYQWLQKNPQFGYTAAINLIKGYYNGGDWSADDLSDSAARLVANGTITPLPAKTKDDFIEEDKLEREDLISWIMENRTWASQQSKESEFARLSRIESNIPIVSTETLRTIKANIEEKRRLTALSKEELKKEAIANSEREHVARGGRLSQYREVPQIYRNRSMLLDLARRDVQAFKDLLLRCGSAQINEILARVETK